LIETSRKRTVFARGMDDDDRAEGYRWRWPWRPDVTAAQT
jgi:hypothetical protein